MAIALAQVIFQGASGLAEDTFVNTFHFGTSGGTVTPTNASDIITRLTDFYNTTHSPGTSPLGNELSSQITRASSQIKVYDLGDPIPRVPVATGTFTLASTGGSAPAPNEVALVGSYKTAPFGGIPLASQRGRFYLGPLMLDNWSASGPDLRPGTAAINKMNGAMNALKVANSASVSWIVYSPTIGASSGGAYQGWVDNAADTQRRRGRVATSRTTWGP